MNANGGPAVFLALLLACASLDVQAQQQPSPPVRLLSPNPAAACEYDPALKRIVCSKAGAGGGGSTGGGGCGGSSSCGGNNRPIGSWEYKADQNLVTPRQERDALQIQTPAKLLKPGVNGASLKAGQAQGLK
jgi:hypothetical protein